MHLENNDNDDDNNDKQGDICCFNRDNYNNLLYYLVPLFCVPAGKMSDISL